MQIDANRNLESILEDSVSLNIASPLSTKMSSDLVDQVYKALRLLPEFDGNPNVLTRFVHLCDQLVLQFVRSEAGFELSNLALLNGILNKVTGHAARTINSNGIPENWQGIRNALINNFSDQRDETALYNDLALMTQKHLSPQEFYEKCQSIFSTIMTYVTLHETLSTTVEAKRTLYRKLTLQAFVRGLKEPLGSRIRCMRPETLEKALEYVHEEINTMYLQQRNDHLPERRMQSTSSSSFDFSAPANKPLNLPFSRPMTFSPAFNNLPGPSKPLSFQPPRPMQIWRPQMPMNRGPSRTQQMFAAPPTNYRPQSNVFRLPQNRSNYQQPGPQPMSGVSHYVTKTAPPPKVLHDWTKHGNPPPTNYFKSRELNFNDGQYYEPFDNYNDYDNFYTEYEPTYYETTYDVTPYDQPYEYLPAYVEETPDESPLENQDFQKDTKSDKQK